MKRHYLITYLLAGASLLLSACHKEFLEKKPSSAIVIPATLADMRALLNQENTMSEGPFLGELNTDDYSIDFVTLQSLPELYRNAYTWAKNLYGGATKIPDWNRPYEQVLYANVVLEGLEKISVTDRNKAEWEEIKGWAHFVRGRAFYNLAELFSLPYDAATAQTDIGIPLRLTADINAPMTRATVQQTYDQVLSDLLQAATLLKETHVLSNKVQATRLTAWAILARLQLSLHNYPQAGAYADSVLSQYNTLIDYNTVSTTGNHTTFGQQNAETLLRFNFATTNQVFNTTLTTTIVKPELYASYEANDLRKVTYYRLNAQGLPNKKAGYTGLTYYFSGLATNEQYLIRAEAAARAGNITAALNDLNSLLVKRYKKGTFVPLAAQTPEQALQLVLRERRKELAFTGLRWLDVRRLNKEGANITMSHEYNGKVYMLPPNDPRFALPIPDDEISLSGITQNPR